MIRNMNAATRNSIYRGANCDFESQWHDKNDMKFHNTFIDSIRIWCLLWNIILNLLLFWSWSLQIIIIPAKLHISDNNAVHKISELPQSIMNYPSRPSDTYTSSWMLRSNYVIKYSYKFYFLTYDFPAMMSSLNL